MKKIGLLAMFLCIQSALGESGESPFEDEETEGEMAIDFECFTRFTTKLNDLICYLKNERDKDYGIINVTVCKIEDEDPFCEEMERKQSDYRFDGIYPLNAYNVCMAMLGRDICKVYRVNDIVRPKPPFNLTVSYEKAEDEYKIGFRAPYKKTDILADHLNYEIVLRKIGEDWSCITTPYDEVLIPGRNLQPVTTYEVKARARPSEKYFKGTASSWSGSVFFESGSMIPLIGSVAAGVLLILIIIVIIVMLWENRIKPHLWPEIPDHKSALEKLCKKPTKVIHLSFTPYPFETMIIDRVENMQAKELKEDESLVPIDAEKVLETATDEQIAGRELHVIACETSMLPDVNVKRIPSESVIVQCNNPADNVAIMASHRSTGQGGHQITPDIISPACENDLETPNPTDSDTAASSTSTIIETSPGPSNAEKPPPYGFKVLSWEEAYIAMSAFKTPISAAK
ncbi:interleukin-7 receptor subunit alpha [Pelodytes ibericus]